MGLCGAVLERSWSLCWASVWGPHGALGGCYGAPSVGCRGGRGRAGARLGPSKGWLGRPVGLRGPVWSVCGPLEF
eukprot:4355323-Pyramimonas_sp.AAC.1